MIGFGNPGVILLLILYFFIFQCIVAILGWKLKEDRGKLLNWNIIIGLLPLFYTIKLLVTRYNFSSDLWNSSDWMYTFFCICAVVNIFLWMLNFVFKNNLIKLRWNFFVYINVIGGWIFMMLII